MILAEIPSTWAGEILTWVDLVFKPVVVLATIYWVIWHRREGRRMVREEEHLFAEAADLHRLVERVETLAPKSDLLLLEKRMVAERQETVREINAIYEQMRQDAGRVAETFRTLTGDIQRVAGTQDAMRKPPGR